MSDKGESEEEVLKRDREQYPNCYHSTSIQQFFSFSSAAGEANDVKKTISRICPGERPVPIFQKSSSKNEHSTMEEGIVNHFTHRSFGDNDFDEGIDSLINSFFGENVFGHGNQEKKEAHSMFGFGAPFGGMFGGLRGGYHEHGGNGRSAQIERETERRETQSVMQPPHSLPKGKSPSIHLPGGVCGVEISPPENIWHVIFMLVYASCLCSCLPCTYMHIHNVFSPFF